jgi:glycosyltransferase involved in cell wall biosynthesis
LRVGLITPGGFDLSRDGQVISALYDLAERLARESKVTVFTLHQFGEPAAWNSAGFDVRRPPHRLSPWRSVAWGLRQIAGEHRREPFTVLHAYWLHTPGLCAAVAGRLLRVPVLASLGGGEMVAMPEIQYGGQLSARRRFAISATARFAKTLTAASRSALEPLLARRPDALHLPLGADPKRFPSSKVTWRERRGIVAIGDLNRVKDYPTLLRAFSRLSPGLAGDLEVFGVDTLSGALAMEAERLGIDDRVRFHGRASQAALGERIRSARLLLHASRHEAGPVAFMEAALSGAPVVSTHVGHMADLASQAAMTAPVGDADRLAREARRVLEDTALSQEIAREAERFARGNDSAWSAREFQALYVELCD